MFETLLSYIGFPVNDADTADYKPSFEKMLSCYLVNFSCAEPKDAEMVALSVAETIKAHLDCELSSIEIILQDEGCDSLDEAQITSNLEIEFGIRIDGRDYNPGNCVKRLAEAVYKGIKRAGSAQIPSYENILAFESELYDHLIKKGYDDHELASEISDSLGTILSSRSCGIKPKISQSLIDMGLDSCDRAEVIMRFEDDICVTIPDHEFDTAKPIYEIAELAYKRMLSSNRFS